MKENMPNDLTLSDQAKNSVSCVKAKAMSKRRAPSSSVSEKLKKMDLSLEAYVHVLLSVQRGLQLHLKFCPLENLRKVLLANNWSPKNATKEFLIAHLHELPLFKPFFSSVGGLNNNHLLVNPIGIKHVDLVEDLNALEWLEYGRALVEPDAQSLLGISVEDASSSTGHPSHNKGHDITEKFPCRSHVISLESKPVPCPGSVITKKHLPLCNNLPEIAQNKGYEEDQCVIDLEPRLSAPECCPNAVVVGPSPYDNTWCRFTAKLPCASNGISVESRSASCFTSAVANPHVPFSNTQQKNMEKVASELVSVIGLDPPQCATPARVVEAEADKNPWPSLAYMSSGINVTSSHQQIDVMNNISSSIVQDEIVHPAGELTLCQFNRNEGQNTSSSKMTQDALIQLVSTWNSNGENALIYSSQDAMAHEIMQLSSPKLMDRDEEKSTLSNRSTSNIAAHDLIHPVYPQNLNREEGGNVFISSNSSQPQSQSHKAVYELVQPACPQPLHRKEEENTIRRASKPGKPFLERVSPPRSIMTEATNAFVSSPSDKRNEAAHDPVQLVSPENLGHAAAGQARIFSNLPAQEASLAPAPQMELNFDAASAGFLDVLSDSVASMPAGTGALSACIENSLNLLEEWEKRRQKSSEMRGRMKTNMQEEKERSCKRVHLQQESENGGGSSFYSQAAIAERCSSLREETSKLLSEYGATL